MKNYCCPKLEVIEIMGKDGVMIEINSEGNSGQLSRTTDYQDSDDGDLSHRQSNVWDEDE